MKNKKTKVAIVGYGNIGKHVLQALEVAPDMEPVAVVRRNISDLPAELSSYFVTDDIASLRDVADVAIICSPSLLMTKKAQLCLQIGISTVDSFDIHSSILEHRNILDSVAKQNSAVAVVSAGWDPGTDSVVRTLMQAMSPQGVTYTNFGPGMSMGHTVAAKAIAGVQDALSVTLPLGAGLHRRMVYVVLKSGASFDDVTASIKSDNYFANDETHVVQVDDIASLQDMGHGVLLERKGTSGIAPNQRFSYSMSINNPALTAQVLVGSARAAVRQQPGAYTLVEIPPVDLLPGDSSYWIKKLV